MPPAIIASSVRSTGAVSPRASSSSSAEAGGNFGRAAEAAALHVRRGFAGSRPPSPAAPRRAPRRSGSIAPIAPSRARVSRRPLAHLLAAVLEGVDDRFHHHAEARHSAALVRREVGAAVEGHAVGVAEDRHRPAALAADRLHRLHVEGVDVGPLLAVDLDADEVLVHVGGGLGVLEGLALHHVAPVAGRVADREQDRPVELARAGQRLRSPRVPVDRVVAVLEQVGAGLLRQAVRHALTLPTGDIRGQLLGGRARRN